MPLRRPGTEEPPRAASTARRSPTSRTRSLRASAGALGLALVLASCNPSEPDPEGPPPAVGRSLGTVRLTDSEDLEPLRELSSGMPRVFEDAEEFEQWRRHVDQHFAALGNAPAEPVLAPTEIDDASEVVVADVYDACDAVHRFVADGPATVRSLSYDSTPEETHLCYAPELTLVVSAVPLEEIDADSAAEVRVR